MTRAPEGEWGARALILLCRLNALDFTLQLIKGTCQKTLWPWPGEFKVMQSPEKDQAH